MNRKESDQRVSKLLAILLGLPWVEILTDLWQVVRKAYLAVSAEGMYEVLDYDATLELCDPEGKLAKFTKRKKVRFLQNDVIAFQDYGWGDGKVLLDYRISPGWPVDRYKVGFKTYVLVSLREVKNRGDVVEFRSEWDIRDGFLKPDGYWDTDVGYRTRRMQMRVIFPEERPPIRSWVEEANRRKVISAGRISQGRLSNGRVVINWGMEKPRLFEHYILRWDW